MNYVYGLDRKRVQFSRATGRGEYPMNEIWFHLSEGKTETIVFNQL